MEGTVFKEKVGSSHAGLEDFKISFYKNFPYLLRIKCFHFHDVAEGSLKWDGSEEHLVIQGVLFLNSDVAQVTPVAGAELFAEKRSFSTVLSAQYPLLDTQSRIYRGLFDCFYRQGESMEKCLCGC